MNQKNKRTITAAINNEWKMQGGERRERRIMATIFTKKGPLTTDHRFNNGS
jgi:hypothetical protein